MFNINKQKKITLKDVDEVIGRWRKSCDDRGEIAVGLYCFVSIDPEKGSFAEDHHRVFGEPTTLDGMMKFLREDFDGKVEKGHFNKKCIGKCSHFTCKAK